VRSQYAFDILGSVVSSPVSMRLTIAVSAAWVGAGMPTATPLAATRPFGKIDFRTAAARDVAARPTIATARAASPSTPPGLPGLS
jgi:hypothetical protein